MIRIFFIILISSVDLSFAFTPEQQVQIDEIDRILSSRNWYEVLQVPQDADDKLVRNAFLKKSLLIHPDKITWDDAVRQRAHQAFQKLSEAKGKDVECDHSVNHNPSRASTTAARKIYIDTDFFRKIFQDSVSDTYLNSIFTALKECACVVNRWECRGKNISNEALIDLKKEIITVFTGYFRLIISISSEWSILKQISNENGRHEVCLMALISDYSIFSQEGLDKFISRIQNGFFTKIVMKFFHDFLKNHCNKEMPRIAGLDGDGVNSLVQYKTISELLLKISTDDFFYQHRSVLAVGAGIFIIPGGVWCFCRKQTLFKKRRKISKSKKQKKNNN